MRNTEATSGIVLALSSAAVSVLLVAALFIAITFSSALDYNSVSPMAVPVAADTSRTVSAIPANARAFGAKRKDELMKKLISEYIVARYTVNGSEREMRRTSLSNTSLVALAGTKIDPLTGQESYSAAYARFALSADGRNPGPEMAEILKYMSDGTTRSVAILSGPRLYVENENRWVTDVEFIIRTAATARLSEARRERWTIHMEVDELGEFLPSGAARYGASAIFGLKVRRLDKLRYGNAAAVFP
ncbi:MAG: hypothetical protein LBO78_02990 [Rickettsiales bacterium]|jgi:hypothetical protein|nr:hypothetical protein [Rickettsiales bacterium]